MTESTNHVLDTPINIVPSVDSIQIPRELVEALKDPNIKKVEIVDTPVNDYLSPEETDEIRRKKFDEETKWVDAMMESPEKDFFLNHEVVSLYDEEHQVKYDIGARIFVVTYEGEDAKPARELFYEMACVSVAAFPFGTMPARIFIYFDKASCEEYPASELEPYIALVCSTICKEDAMRVAENLPSPKPTVSVDLEKTPAAAIPFMTRIREASETYNVYLRETKKDVDYESDPTEWGIKNIDPPSLSYDLKTCSKIKSPLSANPTPKEIYDTLSKKVYKQDAYCKKASAIIYNHLRGINRSTYAINGPSGCGKTYLWEVAKNAGIPVVVIDSSQINAAGVRGINLAHVMKTVRNPRSIVVFDEFDKLVAPRIYSSGRNYSLEVQAEFLKMIEGQVVAPVKTGEFGEDSAEVIDTSQMTFILCGSFEEKAATDSEKTASLGFGRQIEKDEAFSKPVGIEEMMEFGLMKELASRITGVININKLTKEDFENFLHAEGGALAQVVDDSKILVRISPETEEELIESSYNHALGLRGLINSIKDRLNDAIAEDYEAVESGDIEL